MGFSFLMNCFRKLFSVVPKKKARSASLLPHAVFFANVLPSGACPA
jgi:hypothetical protein